MAEKESQTDWTGKRGKRGARLLVSPWRRLEEALLGRSLAVLLEEVLATLGKNAVVLDAGCGSGYLSLPIAKKLDAGRVICVDLSEEMLAGLEKRADAARLGSRIQAVKAAADATGLDDASVDLVVSNNVLHELYDPEAGIVEWERVLKPGGRMALSDLRATRLMKLFIGHRHGKEAHGPFDLEELKALLRKTGLNKVEVAPYRHTLLALAEKQA